jgi:hypothetical protein
MELRLKTTRTNSDGWQCEVEKYLINSLVSKGNGVLPALALLHQSNKRPARVDQRIQEGIKTQFEAQQAQQMRVDHQIQAGIKTLLEADPSLDKSILNLFTDASASAIESGNEYLVGNIARGLAKLKNSEADENIWKLCTDASVSAI